MANILKKWVESDNRELKRLTKIADKVEAYAQDMAELSDDELKAKTPEFKKRYQAGETLDDLLPEAFAVAREGAKRVLGLYPYHVQIIGGIVLHEGNIAEMKTGEGKTLTATMPVYLNALAGEGVHVVTVNEYLSSRDATEMGELYNWLGLSVGLNITSKTPEEKREAYNCDITYSTNSELGFDYLRDNMVVYREDMVQRPLNFCIVDEVDSILIDEARTPLIISGQSSGTTLLYTRTDRFAKTLEKDTDFKIDLESKTVSLTEQGIRKGEQYFGTKNLFDPDNTALNHHLDNALRANYIMIRDKDYVVQDGEVLIVDQFTGRIMDGRRYSDGLHQAIEAKEHVEIEEETKTMANITYQNFFRMYKKLSGMTGTAKTEDEEFREIYNLDVVEVPTNRPPKRIDHSDLVYKTEKGKYNAVIEDIIEHNKKGQPVLVGTISIEKSELLSRKLYEHGIKHNVLNAKHHEQEAEIVAQAGHKGAVTIATNMAGRGTDIMLGGNGEFKAKQQLRFKGYPEEVINEAVGYAQTEDTQVLKAREEYRKLVEHFTEQSKEEAEEVRQAGGLYIIGTERHESRRIDNQLRGRAGRQGDPGESRFYISLEDDLMRLFGGERIAAVMGRLNIDENTPIENNMLTNTIENAQRKVEARNFATRKNVLQYDDVMNRQRELIYKQRDQVLDGDNVKDEITKMMHQSVEDTVDAFLPDSETRDEWNIVGLRDNYMGWLLTEEDLQYSEDELKTISKNDIKAELIQKVDDLSASREELFGEQVTRELERVVMLKCVDVQWMDHIDAMEQLKRGIHLRGYAQRDPVVEYRNEGYDMFDQMIANIRDDTTRLFLSAKIQVIDEQEAPKEMVESGAGAAVKISNPDEEEENASAKPTAKVGRNDPCPCGSGKKYKKCCGKNK